MWRPWRVAIVGLSACASLGLCETARAADSSCFDAYEQAQRLRKAGKLLDAREQALVCAAEACPDMVKKDCALWSVEIGREIPTVVFAAKEPGGADVTATAVYVDDRKVADSIDGRPVPIDPGPHKVRFESGDRKTETTIEIASGDSSRRVEGTFAPPPAPPPPPPQAYLVQHLQRRPIPKVSLVLGGVAAVGLVSFVTFAIAGRVELGCQPDCEPGQISTLRAEYAVADASWITGLAALGGAFVFWLAQPGAPSADVQPAKAAALHFEAIPEPGGASFGLGGRF